jgi:hypothetical protein
MSEKGAQITGPFNWFKNRAVFLSILLIVVLGIAALTIALLLEKGETIPVTGEEAQGGPARVEPMGDTGFSRVILTERAAERLDIQTEPVQEQLVEEEARLAIPYSAVIYGLNGETWAYVNSETLTYHREPILIDYIEGELAILIDGPPAGTDVVTVGVAELYGTETGVGK